jgi:hypothetical protein
MRAADHGEPGERQAVPAAQPCYLLLTILNRYSAGCLRAGVHDVAQPLARISVILICRKAIPILANRALKVVLSGGG